LINDLKNSAASPLSKSGRIPVETAIVAVSAAVLIALAAAWFYAQGFILYYGDAQSHLNISRRIIDSRTPGYDQIGGVWLPVLHLICLPFVANDFLWSSGLAGTLPVAGCFIVAVIFFYLAAREIYNDWLAAAITAACFALNPNLLYLGSIPMAEVVFLAAFSVQLFSLLRFRRTQHRGLVVAAAIASILASLTRYDGWFLIPFFALGFLIFAAERRFQAAALFVAIASLGPLYWMAHNQWVFGDALDFYRGPYSAKAINQRAIDAGQPPYRGDHNWALALFYYATAGRFCTGWSLFLLGMAGAGCAIWKRRATAIWFLLLTPAFYVWSMYSSNAPIFVPTLYPFNYYNTRYGIAVLPLAAFGVGALVLLIPRGWRKASVLLPVVAISPWAINHSRQSWICWKESESNSISRRIWTARGAKFLERNYQPGDGMLISFGDVPGILCKARIHVSESLYEGNGPAWLINAYRPEMIRSCKWAISELTPDDPISHAIERANYKKVVYQMVLEIHTKKDPVIRIYRRAE
jgi:hypothetical protein